ncbi:DnaJ-domain-containing protein [Ramaria rubella]|nr:DnaJ-domain-containing protein [Ramaria rubella]
MANAFSLLVLFLCVILASAADFYKVLDIHKSADDATIKKAYRKLSRRYHPDKNKDPGADEKFVEVARAYEVLSDPQKRGIYDRHGEEGLRQHEGGQRATNPMDMFSAFFGGHQHQEVRRGPTMTSDFEVSLEDMYKGAEIDFMIHKKILCDHCRGSGAASDRDIQTCPTCDGSGVQITRQQMFPGMVVQGQTTCTACGGRGKIITQQCPHCSGQKVVSHTQHYTLEVPAGVPEGHEVVFEAEGDESPDWEAGDVIIRVRGGKKRGGWRRKEHSLYWTETIGVEEALLGFERNLTHLDGHTVMLNRDAVTQPGKLSFVQTVKGEGMPIFRGSGHGDLYVEYTVVLPTQLSPEVRKKLLEVFRGRERSSKDEL